MKLVDRQILGLAIPAIVANITTPLLSMVDVTIVGHLGSALYLGAIAIGGSMFNMVYWLFGFLRMGTSGLGAQACGSGNVKTASLVLYRALLLAVTGGAVIIALRHPVASLTLKFIGPDAATSVVAQHYFMICVWGAPAVLATYAMSGWLLGMQSSRSQMWVALIINVVNIAASLILVYGFHAGVTGVASGTLTAQWVGAVAAAVMCRRFSLCRVNWAELLHLAELKRFLKVNMEIMLRTMCLIAVTVWFTRAGARQSTVMLDVNALLMQLFILFSYMMDGFAYAGEALCGRYTGASDHASLGRVVRALVKWGVILASLFTVVYMVAGYDIISLMTSEHEVKSAAAEYMGWAVTVPAAGFLAFTFDGVMIGTTRTRLMLTGMVVATVVFFAVYLSLFHVMGNHGLWLAFILYLLARGVVMAMGGRSIYLKQHN